MPNRHTGYCRILGIISATRVPFPQPFACRYDPNAADSVLSSSKVSVLPMHVYDGRSPYLATLSSNTSRTDAYSLTSISAGTPFGYSLSQIFSTNLPPRAATLRRVRVGAAPFFAVPIGSVGRRPRGHSTRRMLHQLRRARPPEA